MQRRSFMTKAAAWRGVLAADRRAGIVHAPGQHPLAPGLQLSEVARHDLRRGRGVRQEVQRDDRRQVPDQRRTPPAS